MKKGDESKRKIIEAGARVFDKKGYENASLQDVLNETNMSKGGFYHYFSTKLDLLRDIYSLRVESWYNETMEKIQSGGKGALQKLKMTLSMLNMLEKNSPRLPVVLSKLHMAEEDPTVKEMVRKLTVETVAPFIGRILAEGNEQGVFFVRRTEETAIIITLLSLDINDESIKTLTEGRADSASVEKTIDLLVAYRESIETLVSAPYASLSIFNAKEMIANIRSVYEE